MDRKPEIKPMTMQTLREIKLTQPDKQRLALLFCGVLVVFAFSIVIFDSLFHYGSSALAYYPGNCGSYNTSQGLYTCLSTLANKTANVSVCLYMQGSQSLGCVSGVAERSNNPNICGYISKTGPYYVSCISAIENKTGNIALCGSLPQSSALSCIYSTVLALNFSSASTCELIGNTSYSIGCSALVNYRKALLSSNPDYCEMIQNTRNYSVLSFMDYNSSMSSASAADDYLYALNVTAQSYCYLGLAIQELNATICNRIQGSFSTTCGYYVEAANESTVKANLNATNSTTACVSYKGYDLELCNLEYQTGIAIERMNATPCYSLNSSVDRDLCVYHLAINTSDYGYCSDILNTTIRGVCTLSANYTAT